MDIVVVVPDVEIVDGIVDFDRKLGVMKGVVG